MKPLDICKHLGSENINAYYAELSGKELRAVLKAGGSHSNTPSTAFSQAKRRKIWRKRFDAEFGKDNEQLALAFLIEWLMRHHREMLVSYLDFLEVKHNQGETDEDFCETKTPEQLNAGVDMLLEKYPRHEVGTYLLLVGHLQETPIYDESAKVLGAVGVAEAEIEGYIEAFKKRWAERPPAE